MLVEMGFVDLYWWILVFYNIQEGRVTRDSLGSNHSNMDHSLIIIVGSAAICNKIVRRLYEHLQYCLDLWLLEPHNRQPKKCSFLLLHWQPLLYHQLYKKTGVEVPTIGWTRVGAWGRKPESKCRTGQIQ